MNNRFAFLSMVDSSPLLEDVDALRARFDADGYLLLRGVLDVEKLKSLRQAVLRVTQELGWTDPGQAQMAQRCIITPLREEDDEFIAGYERIQRLQEFHELAHDPALSDVMAKVLGPTAFVHPLKIARLAFPDHYEASTPPHQDYPNNQGTTNLTATWIPLSDVPAALGGLAVLRGSHKWGLLPLAGHIGAGNRCAVIPDDMAESCRWVTSELALGDLLVFPSLTVHASLHNVSEFFMRLSVDFRWQLEGEALTPGCLQPHFGTLSWEQIYEDWDDTGHQYYWKDLNYEVVPFEALPIQGSGSEELSAEDFAEILRYEARVKARTKRRMELLGRRLHDSDRHSTTFERHSR